MPASSLASTFTSNVAPASLGSLQQGPNSASWQLGCTGLGTSLPSPDNFTVLNPGPLAQRYGMEFSPVRESKRGDILPLACCFPLHQVVLPCSGQGGKLCRDGEKLSPVPCITKDSLTTTDAPACAALAAGKLGDWLGRRHGPRANYSDGWWQWPRGSQLLAWQASGNRHGTGQSLYRGTEFCCHLCILFPSVHIKQVPAEHSLNGFFPSNLWNESGSLIQAVAVSLLQ